MKCSITLLFTLICVFSRQVKASQRGYICVVPRVLAQNSVNKIQFRTFNIDGPGKLTLRLLTVENSMKTDNKTVYAEQEVSIEAGVSENVIDFDCPEIADYEARFQISGKFEVDGEDDYQIFGEDTVTFKTALTKIIFIQTDKPIYKPGQKVQFRVLLVDSSLRPFGGNTQVEIWVEEPSGARVAQWKNVTLGNGIVQREVQLSEEPILGNWKIVVSTDGLQESTYFEEKEYVLPKYEVTIKPPSFALVTDKTIPVEICGKYTYGKLVEGTLKINTSVETYSWSYDKFPTIEYEGEIEGCYTYNINVSAVDEDLKYTYRRIMVFAQINETGTGISRNATIYIERLQRPLNLRFETESRQYFKPGLPYHGSLKVTHPDDKAAADEPVEICVTVSRERQMSEWWATRKVKYCRNYTSDENGLVPYTVPPQNTDAVSMSIEAKSMKYLTTQDPAKPTIYQPQTNSYLRPWYSPSGSHIQVQSIRDPLPCGSKANIEILFTAKQKGSYKFYYEVVSSGKVLENDEVVVDFKEEDDISGDDCDDVTLEANEIQLVPPPASPEKNEETKSEDDDNCKVIKDARYVPMVGSVNISVDVSADNSPSFYFLVYYVREDRETVADSQQFAVDKCFKNKVDLKFQDKVKQPGEKTTLRLSSSPNSLCGIKVIDKSITLLDNSDQLTKEKVFEALQRYERGLYYPRNHCNDKKVQPGLERKLASNYAIILPPRPWSSSAYEDALTAFESSGFFVISDMILYTRPCKNNNQNYEAFGGVAMPSMGIRGAAFASQPARSPVNKVMLTTQSAGMGGGAPAEDAANFATKSVVDVRTFFPETWLFDLLQVGDEGEIVKKETLPHTITEWLGSAVCINAEVGLGLSSETAQVKGFQAFFLSLTLPYSVIRGEKVPVIVTVFNYLDKCLPISLEFEQSDGYILLSDSSTAEFCVCGGKSESKEFIIQPTILGTLNLTMSGRNAENSDVCGDEETSTAVARDALTNPLLVEAEGFPYEKVTNALFCPKDAENGIYNQKFSFELPEDVVEDSGRGYLSVSGDIMGSTIQNLDRLVRLPTGCGEQNMVTFTPIVSVLDYLKATGQLKDSVEKKAKGYLISGYQRELKYRHPDGSFSAFGSRDKSGSIWLTAFVLRSFASASRYIDIDDNIQKSAMNWILSKQNSDGSFPEIGVTLSHGIKGGLNASSSALTAYCLSSLIIAGLENTSVVEMALTFISAEEDELSDPYKAALFAYTFALAGEEKTAAVYVQKALDKAETNGEETYWRVQGSTKSSVSVEIAAYVILTLLKLGEPMQKSLPVVRAITKSRNSQGGFVSTQDTVLGLEALSQFATLLNKDPVDLKITVSGDLTEEITFTDDDKMLVKKHKLPAVPAEVTLEASGSGCGLVQATVLCNTLKEHKEEFFSLSVETSRSSDCKSVTIKTCARYLPEGKRSNMAVVELKMLSGIVASKESLESLLSDRNLQLKRYDVENNNVVFYYDELTNENKCWEFQADEAVKIGDRKPATAKVYDYYATERKQETTYTIEECA